MNTPTILPTGKLLQHHPHNLYLNLYWGLKKIIAKETQPVEGQMAKLVIIQLHKIKRTKLPWLFSENITRTESDRSYTNWMSENSSQDRAHTLLMKREEPQIYSRCSTPLTVKHIFTEYLNFNREKRESCLPYHISETLNPKLTNVRSICMEFPHISKLLNKI